MSFAFVFKVFRLVEAFDFGGALAMISNELESLGLDSRKITSIGEPPGRAASLADWIVRFYIGLATPQPRCTSSWHRRHLVHVDASSLMVSPSTKTAA